jgi:DNA-binding NtrC family response regulator
MAKVLIVDDEPAQRTIMCSILQSENHTVAQADGVDRALQMLADVDPAVVLTDLKMQGRGGLELVEEVSRRHHAPEVVVITAFGSVDTAVRAMRLGAYDYLTKPIERDELLLTVERAADKFRLRTDGARLREEQVRSLSTGLVTESNAMRQVMEVVRKVAPSDATVLIRGESGTGKERIARLIHALSQRGTRPIQSVNCAAFPETLLESELFGYEKGAFTGAQTRKIGILEAASGSTLFLDEVVDMSVNTQAKLLRVLQEREIRRVGSTTNVPVDIRVIAASNMSMEDAIKKGRFREDLFYRLNVIPIVLPPLRDRPEDIEQLVRFFLARRSRSGIDPEALDLLRAYPWPGNVRELEAVMERVIILSSNDRIAARDLPEEIRSPVKRSAGESPGFELPSGGIVFEEWERNLLQQALGRSGGTMAEAARLLGMTYRTFQYRAEKFGLLHGQGAQQDQPAQ